MKRSARRACVCLILVVAGAGGCLPNRFVIDLAPSDGRLEEREVVVDPGATAKVALIDVDGLLSHASGGGALIQGSGNSVDELVSRLDKAEKDPGVRAVVLRVNSPGGTVAASETMYNEITRFRERTKKPVVVSMAEVAASGGYYISLAADRIIAQRSTITGSIGVLVQTVNLSQGMAMIGIEGRAVTSAPNKDIANPLEPMREEHYRIIQATVDEFYAGFRALVVARRPGINPSRLDTLTDGRVLTGDAAAREGLVDATGDLRDALAAAKELSGTAAAKMVKYHTPGRAPASPYATALAPAPGAGGASLGGPGVGLGGGLVSLSLTTAPIGGSGFYYLWLAPGR